LELPDQRDFGSIEAVVEGRHAGRLARRVAQTRSRRAPLCRPERMMRGRCAEQAMPGHGAFSRMQMLGVGGARGWHQRAKASMTVMCPPQHGQGRRLSRGSSGSIAVGGMVMPSSLRASARLSLRAELESRP